MAAQKEWGIVVGGPAPSIAFKDAVNVYRDACASAGTTPSVGFIKAIYLHEDEATAHAEAREAAVNFVRYNVAPQLTIMPTNDAGTGTPDRCRLQVLHHGLHAEHRQDGVTMN